MAEREIFMVEGFGDPDGPPVPVELTPERVACPRHGQVFAEGWPRGYLPFGLALFTAFVENEANATDLSLDEVFSKRPLCERVSTSELIAAYLESGVFTESLCNGCGELGMGVPYAIHTPRGPRHFDHLCITCIVYRMQPIN